MKIACLGWGSLVWDPRGLPVHDRWYCDGPSLPVEFCRESMDRRITLAIASEAKSLPVLWSVLKVNDISEAVAALGEREGIPPKNRHRDVGVWRSDGPCTDGCSTVVDGWGHAKCLDAVVWTALPAKFAGEVGRMPTEREVIEHLRGLQGPDRNNAEKYVRMAPKQIRTAYRRAVEEALAWTPSSTIYSDKVADIAARADVLHRAYYTAETFRGPSLYFHRRALEYRDDRDFNRYLELIYATLTAWGMHRMGKGGSKMQPFEAFRDSVSPLRDRIRYLAAFRWHDLTHDKWLALENVFRAIKIMASGTTLVGNSKVLAHMFPDLVPPVDRQYTLKYLIGKTEIKNDLDLEWARLKEIVSEFFVPVVANPVFRTKAEAWVADPVQFPWDTSIMKVVDNLVIGAGKTK